MNMDAGTARGGVSILGAGRTSVVVRVANLALGTTAEDVVVSLLSTCSSCPFHPSETELVRSQGELVEIRDPSCLFGLVIVSVPLPMPRSTVPIPTYPWIR